MRKRRLIIGYTVLLALMVIFLVLMSSKAYADTDVTADPTIQADLALAVTFWHYERPDLASPCASVNVVIGPMVDGVGDDGQTVLAVNAWAETEIGGCVITIAPVVQPFIDDNDTTQQWEVCILIAHEYGHVLGLSDTQSIPMMRASDWKHRDDPLCMQHVLGWRNTPVQDREWLAEHHLALRHRRGVAP